MKRENKYTDKYLISLIKEYYNKHNKLPRQKDITSVSRSTYNLRFGSWSKVISLAGLDGTPSKQKDTDYTDQELIDRLWDYYYTYDKVPTTRELKKNKQYPNPQTYSNHFGSYKNALVIANLYKYRKDKYNFDVKTYSNKELLNLLKSFVNDIGYIPSVDELDNNKSLPCHNVYYNRFGSLENAYKLIGYKYDRANCNKSDEELLQDLKTLYEVSGIVPEYRDIQTNLNFSGKVYVARFGGWYETLEKAGIPYTKRNKFLTDEEIIKEWEILKNELGRVPACKEFDLIYSIWWRWGSYYDFLVDYGYNDIELSNLYSKIHITDNGTKCRSRLELIITSYFENNNIEFYMNYPYKNALQNDNTARTFDWMVKQNNNTYYIEMFGIIGNEDYYEKTKRKIEDCKKNNINLVALYPDDLKKPLNEVFSFLNH